MIVDTKLIAHQTEGDGETRRQVLIFVLLTHSVDDTGPACLHRLCLGKQLFRGKSARQHLHTHHVRPANASKQDRIVFQMPSACPESMRQRSIRRTICCNTTTNCFV